MSLEKGYKGGKLVALEGDTEQISTQLRLLPPSQKILILPALQPTSATDPDTTFDARAVIRDVHTALSERIERARSFLQSSTSSQPRLVFMNGGTVSARATCIARISENVTDGKVGEAEAIFNEIIQDGAAALRRVEEKFEKDDSTSSSDEDEVAQEGNNDEDPSITAMKAAESLDRETEALQTEGVGEVGDVFQEEEYEIVTASSFVDHDRVESIVSNGDDNETASEKPIFNDVFGTTSQGQIVQTVLTMPNGKKGKPTAIIVKPKLVGTRNGNRQLSPFTAASEATAVLLRGKDGIYGDDVEEVDPEEPESLGDASGHSRPPTPGVVYGEAEIVDIQSARQAAFERRKSAADALNFPRPSLLHSQSESHLRSRSQIPRRSSNGALENLPTPKRASFLRASQTIIRRPSSMSGSVRSATFSPQASRISLRLLYTDRGTDAEDIPEPAKEPVEEPFEPLFVMAEDMVIHFQNGEQDEILESVMQSYKNDNYTISSMTPSREIPSDTQSPPDSDEDHDTIGVDPYSTAETDDGYEGDHEFDPYAVTDYPASIKRQRSPKKPLVAENSISRPPTPTLTPPPSRGTANEFLTFSAGLSGNAINVQNSLRQLLDAQFPTGENGYSQFCYPVSPEADRLWKPVFRIDNSTTIGNESRTVDQIIALGREDGVKNDFFVQISGQVERLGSKRDGLNKGGKLDISYLIANAMQTAVSQYPQLSVNPLSQPAVLAALLVPQLESYLASNIETRLLILQYTSAHLPTIFALRKLIGHDLFKIAGILDSLASDPPSMSRPRTPINTVNPLSNDAVASRIYSRFNTSRSNVSSPRPGTSGSVTSYPPPKQEKKLDTITFARADYLIPSSATTTEVTNFINLISKSLVEKSPFYTPEPEIKPVIVEKVVEKIVERIVEKQIPMMPPTPTSVVSSPIRDLPLREPPSREKEPPPMAFRNNNTSSKLARLTGSTNLTPNPPSSSHSHSRQKSNYASSIMSTRTTASEFERREDRGRIEREWENFYIGEDDSEDDEYDRMIMGRALAKIVPEIRMPELEKKRNTKKALKWLGLA